MIKIDENANPQEVYRLLFENQYIDKDCGPLKCTKCDSAELDEKVTDTIGGLVTEKIVNCNKCKKILGSWAYGQWEPLFV